MELCILLFLSMTATYHNSDTLLICQANAMVGSFLLSFPQELCFVAEHFVVMDAEIGAHPALISSGKGKIKACFVLGVKAVMSVKSFFPGKILPQSCTCLSKTQ